MGHLDNPDEMHIFPRCPTPPKGEESIDYGLLDLASEANNFESSSRIHLRASETSFLLRSMRIRGNRNFHHRMALATSWCSGCRAGG